MRDSVNARLEISRCMFLPQFWDNACASCVVLADVPRLDKEIRAYLESIELDICVTVSKTFDHALDGLLRAALVTRHLVAYFHDGTPILRGGVFVCRLGYSAAKISTGALNVAKDTRRKNTYRRHRRKAQPLLLETWSDRLPRRTTLLYCDDF